MDTETKTDVGRCAECGGQIDRASLLSDLCPECESKSLRELGLGFQLENLWKRVCPLLPRFPPLTTVVVILNLAVYFIIVLGQHYGWSNSVQAYLALNRTLAVRGEWWRLVSYSFVQVRLLHLLSNVVLLLFLGRLVESQLEPANFVLLLVATAVSGAVIDTVFRARNFTAIGSSGMVFGLIGALLSFYILGRVPLSRWALVRRLSLLGGLSLMSLVAEFLSLRRVNLIHIGGLAAGVVFASVVPLKPVEQANEEEDR
jgi:rhomboid protease GluP